ncbi:hypothetical protein BWQ96_05175 [Gracilariopsis chorda]|uniref:Uncharacterized protein n=1 Tax=Gracilariopsis chorda TaxID=448386 RepID=A0A2V3ISH9_9FLOR|nr:hypothetical protein BWQ96_05175 [Gracilariopsis chorda]|eukprot:PXF45073.1 hypothetical protein BWQ96_05175 [Gracilariopsis chorda]
MHSPAFLSSLPARLSPAPARARARPRISCTASPTATTPTLQRFLSWFRSDFDNYYQVAHDRSSGVSYSRIHEHVHCRLQPLLNEDLAPPGHAAVFATYYYNGNPDIVYRRRLYTLSDEEDAVEMRVYKMCFIHGLLVARANSNFDSLDMGSVNDPVLYEHLDGAQILWRYVEEHHPGSDLVANGPHFFGTMRHGSYTSRDSLRYEDELVLTKEDLWVRERVFNSDGVMVGGHRDGIPHKMRRVRRQDEIKWTLDFDLPDLNLPE